MNSYNINKIQNILNSVHPKQIINRVGNVTFSMHEIKYEYITSRGNKKEGVKYLMLNSLNPQSNTQEEMNKWVEEYNINNQHRQISNVKILGSLCIGYINI